MGEQDDDGRRENIRRRPCAGVSLIELIVVLAIIGVAATLAAPSLFNAADKFTLNSTGRQFVAFLRAGRNEAKATQRELMAVVDGRELNFEYGGNRKTVLRLAEGISVESGQENEASQRSEDVPPSYAFLPTGQILGPQRLELSMRGRYRGFIRLGPGPGAVTFESAR